MSEDFRQVGPEDFEELEVQTGSGPMEKITLPDPSIRKIALDSAQLKMVEHMYSTPEDRMAELTYLGAHEPSMLAFMMMFDDMSKPDYVVGTAFERWRHHFFRLRRSVHGKHINKGYGLAEAGMLTEEKEPTGSAYEFD